VSYSTYLCHFFIKDWVLFTMVDSPRAPMSAIIAYLALTLAASYALHRFVELPGQRLVKDMWSHFRVVRSEVVRDR
jgi:peptidoglycan/LPS O-acetylase OafA/YrhL